MGTSTDPDPEAVERRLSTLEVQLREARAELARAQLALERVSAPPRAASQRPGRTRGTFDPGAVEAIYARRFSPDELRRKSEIWSRLAPFWERRFPTPARSVLAVGAGEGEFLDHVRLPRRVAIDLNPAVEQLRSRGIEPVVGNATRLEDFFEDDSFDVVFCSNLLEHFYDKDQIHLLFREVCAVLRPGGRFLILQPDIRFVGHRYWDFIDHKLAITAPAVAEALEAAGFLIRERRDRFLPFTTKSRLSRLPWLVSVYLRLPLAWRLLGAQAFLVGEKPAR